MQISSLLNMIFLSLFRLLSAEPSLEQIQLQFSTSYLNITNLIPNRFDFQGGDDSNYSILDTGDHMYNVSGNFMHARYDYQVPYSAGSIISNNLFGENSRYFTKKYTGLFMMAAETNNLQSFCVKANSGDRQFTTTTLTNGLYTAYSRKIFGSTDPTINELIIFKTLQGKQSRTGDGGQLIANNLNSNLRIYYFLFSSSNGIEISTTQNRGLGQEPNRIEITEIQTQSIFQQVIYSLDNIVDGNKCYSSHFDLAGICTACTSPCSNCSGTATSCLSCIAGSYRTNLATCACDGSYFDLAGVCTACTSPCLNCVTTATSCTSCITNSDLTDLATCACDGSYFNQAGTCTACTSPCSNCSGTATSCLSCIAGSYRTNLATCACDGSYFDLAGVCTACVPTCQSCLNKSDECTSCIFSQKRELIPLQNNCQCKRGYYIHLTNDTCEECDLNCQDCDKTADNCTACKNIERKTLSQNKCVCQDGYFMNTEDICIACTQGCTVCSSLSSFGCSNIRENQINEILGSNGQLIILLAQVPQSSFFPNCTVSKCLECNDDKNFCLKCQIGFFKHLNYCFACDYLCLSCEGLSSNCTSCKYGQDEQKRCTSCRDLNQTQIGQSCITKCGDGLIHHTEECDDGNFDNRDMCSNQCKKQQLPIYLVYKVNKEQDNYFSNNRTIEVSFNQILSFQEQEWIIRIQIQKTQIQIKQNQNNSLLINVLFNETYQNPILHIEAPKNTNKTFIPQEMNIVLQSYVLIEQEHKVKTKQVSVIGVSILYIFIFIILTSFLLGGNQLVKDQLELILHFSFINFINVELPYNVQEIMSVISNFNFSVLGKFLVQQLDLLNYFNIPYDLKVQPDPKFSGKGMTSIFIFNLSGPLILFIIVAFSYLLSKLILWKFKTKFQWVRQHIRYQKYMNYIHLEVWCTRYITFVVVNLVEVFISIGFDLNLSIFLQLSQPIFEYSEILLSFSTTLALITLALQLIPIGYMFNNLQNSKIYKNKPQFFDWMIKLKFYDYQFYNKISTEINIMYAIKKIFYMFGLVYLYENPFLQISAIGLPSFLIAIKLLKDEKQNEKLLRFKKLVLEITSGIIYILIMVIAINCQLQHKLFSPETIESLGWIIASQFIGCLLFYTLVDIYINLKTIEFIAKLCTRIKEKVYPLNEPKIDLRKKINITNENKGGRFLRKIRKGNKQISSKSGDNLNVNTPRAQDMMQVNLKIIDKVDYECKKNQKHQ